MFQRLRGFWRGFFAGFDIMPPRRRLVITPPTGDPLIADWKALGDDMKVALYGFARSREAPEARPPDLKLTQKESRDTEAGSRRR